MLNTNHQQHIRQFPHRVLVEELTKRKLSTKFVIQRVTDWI
jgi:hypothetical protein